jgi:hypothetical protein
MMTQKFTPLFLALALALTGCSSPPAIYPPELTPPYVRQIKSFRLYGYEDKINTNILLNSGELVTVIASKEHFKSLLVGNIVSLVGRSREILFWTSSWVRSGLTFASPEGGCLAFELTKSFGYKGSFDFFEISVVVWKTNDYGKIVDFLTELQAKHPKHPGVSDALEQANALKKIEIAKTTVSKDLAATQTQLEELRKERDQQTAASQTTQRAHRVKMLENRLSLMTAKLAELEELSRKLLEQREKTAELSQKVEEWEKREKETLAKNISYKGVPPTMMVVYPEDGHLSETENIRVSGVVEDDEGIKKVEVYLNGQSIQTPHELERKAGEGAAPLRRLTFERDLTLKTGNNNIRIIATDTAGLSVEKNITVNLTPSGRNVWTVVVGINDYPRLPKLKHAVNDAQAVYRLLVDKNRVPAENITLLVNEQATLRNLRSALGTGLKSAPGLGDMVIIFFAGHGATERDAASPDGDGLEKYLLAYDSDPADLFSTGMPMRDIALIFNRIRSERLIFIADTCYSGASGGRTVGTGGLRANISDTFLERLAGGRGKVIITASAANEVSVEKDELQHGVFTYYLLEGLRGAADTDRDGAVTVDEAYRYVSEKVPRATGQEQHPVKKGSIEGSLVLSITR